MKQIIKKVVIPIVILILVVGWVQEISLRRAIQATANVMEPFARQSKDRWAISYHKFGIIRVVSEDDSISVASKPTSLPSTRGEIYQSPRLQLHSKRLLNTPPPLQNIGRLYRAGGRAVVLSSL
jgi:exopolysaccharide biosynthesis protein